MSRPKVAVGVLISGAGSNMSALIAASRPADYPARIALVISNRPEAAGLAAAAAEGIPTLVLDHAVHATDRQAHERALDSALRAAGVQVVVLAGYMRVLTPWFVAAWSGRLLNIHPSLLPAFPGLNTHARVLAAGAAEHGCTVHLVTPGVDEGPILAQARVAILAGDDAETLAARVLEAEHTLYPRALAEFCRRLAAP